MVFPGEWAATPAKEEDRSPDCTTKSPGNGLRRLQNPMRTENPQAAIPVITGNNERRSGANGAAA